MQAKMLSITMALFFGLISVDSFAAEKKLARKVAGEGGNEFASIVTFQAVREHSKRYPGQSKHITTSPSGPTSLLFDPKIETDKDFYLVRVTDEVGQIDWLVVADKTVQCATDDSCKIVAILPLTKRAK